LTGDVLALGHGAALFKKSEDYHGGAPHAWRRRRMAGGKAAPVLEILDAFRDAAAQVGIPKTDDFNRGDNFGCAISTSTKRHPLEHGQGLPEAGRQAPNLTIMTGCHVERLLIEDSDRASLPRRAFHRRRHAPSRDARRETLLAAGAIGSPQILHCPASARPRCCMRTASRRWSTCPASAKTCRTICSCA
jgi:choline dehydrogenase